MPGKVIGKTMNYGWAGKITMDADFIINSRIVSDASGSTAIQFGSPVFLNTDNTVRNFAAATDTTLAKFVGVAVSATARQSINYDTQEAKYEPASQCDILTRGTVLVALPASYSTTVVAGGKVYLDASTGAFTPDAGSSPSANIEVANARFATGLVDGNKMAEITLLSKNLI